jgi:hypothetical protein
MKILAAELLMIQVLERYTMSTGKWLLMRCRLG